MNIWFLLETFQFFGMNKLWTERIPPSINVTSPSHVAAVHFLLSVSLSTQLLETYVSIIFQQFNILLPPNFLLNKNSFFWASSDMYIVYLLWYQIWYNICRRDTFFHAPAIGSFTARAHMIIKIFTGNFHIFNHLNLIRTHVRMIHFHTRFFVSLWTNYMIKMLHIFRGSFIHELWFLFFCDAVVWKIMLAIFQRYCFVSCGSFLKWYKHPLGRHCSMVWFIPSHLFINQTLPVRMSGVLCSWEAWINSCGKCLTANWNLSF